MGTRKQELKLSTICKMEGAAERFDKAVETIVADVQSRRSLDKKRTLTLTIDFEPDSEDEDNIVVKPVVKVKLPNHQLNTYTMTVGAGRNANKLRFSPGSSEDPHQQNFLDDDEEENESGDG